MKSKPSSHSPRAGAASGSVGAPASPRAPPIGSKELRQHLCSRLLRRSRHLQSHLAIRLLQPSSLPPDFVSPREGRSRWTASCNEARVMEVPSTTEARKVRRKVLETWVQSSVNVSTRHHTGLSQTLRFALALAKPKRWRSSRSHRSMLEVVKHVFQKMIISKALLSWR